ncbi:GL12439 [Drosophila persimilis]|uniref:GL12439 n=1 Tax=Drosophila persimilis TaxID=7234 RepID=B4GMS5_DROPE|nr:GL12439 [Drosophila persimilis]
MHSRSRSRSSTSSSSNRQQQLLELVEQAADASSDAGGCDADFCPMLASSLAA